MIVACPLAPYKKRGYDLPGAVLDDLKHRNPTDRFEFLIRDSQISERMKSVTQQVRAKPFVRMYEGTLTDEKYVEMTKSADIVLTPYPKAQFYARTSKTWGRGQLEHTNSDDRRHLAGSRSRYIWMWYNISRWQH